MQIFTSPFGNLARFHLGTWQVFVWELGKFLFGNLASFCLGTWQKTSFPKNFLQVLRFSLKISQMHEIRTSIRVLGSFDH